MPIAGWNCPYCTDKQASLDHYAVTDCGLKIHPAYAAAILADEESDPHGTELTVTNGLACPRSRALEVQEQVYVNPLDYNALLLGRAWDAIVAAGNKVQLRGEIAGLPITGELDNIRQQGDRLILSDWKHSNNMRAYWVYKEGGPSMEYKIQTSIYAELYRQMHGETPTHGEVVYHFSGAGGAFTGVLKQFQSPAMLPYQYDIIPVEDCLAYKPYNGQYTVEELYKQSADIYIPDEPVRWQQLPLVGQTMSFGTKDYCDYCQVRDACFTAAKGAPF